MVVEKIVLGHLCCKNGFKLFKYNDNAITLRLFGKVVYLRNNVLLVIPLIALFRRKRKKLNEERKIMDKEPKLTTNSQ